MQKKVYYEIFTLIFFIEIECAMYKTNDAKLPNPTYFLQRTRLPFIGKSFFFLLSNNKSNERNKTLTTSSNTQSSKQHIHKINRKQYDVINMFWRKTKIFIDVESYTESYHPNKKDNLRIATVNFVQQRNPFQLPLRPSLIHTSTPSYIEFYYLHELDDCIKNGSLPNINNSKQIEKSKLQIKDNFIATGISTSSLQNNVYRDNKETKINSHQTECPAVVPYTNSRKNYYSISSYISVTNNAPGQLLPLRLLNTLSTENKFVKKTNIYKRNFHYSHNYKNINKLKLQKDEYQVKPTFYDRIKFFELNDNQTQIPVAEENLQDFKNAPNYTSKQSILLEYIHNNNDHIEKETRQGKKHIVEKKNILIMPGIETYTNNLNSTRRTMSFNLQMESRNYSENMTKVNTVKHESTTYKALLNYINKSVLWTEYPFTAVYIYEPSQVRCDSAAISPHWLVTSGSCLSRHRGNLGVDGQSAFVTYCGNSWWLPERVAYVKYSLVHPKYHPRDRTRRQLYNIGVIQIVSSMASACPSWSPVSLMSHQFAANTDGSKATAVGWGLDRYDTRYSSTELPKRPLMSYESLVHSDSCPGNFEYRNSLDRDFGAKNVYCLSLPPYNGEENDPIHGGLLLVEEKLTAMYLQEERRPWGEQSAQYTGTWRLIPWILDVARESDETDTFTIDV